MEGRPSITLPDPVAMAIAIEPGICTRASTHLVEVETMSELTRGQTVVDQLNAAARRDIGSAWSLARPLSVCWELDIPRWKALLRECLS
jgi:purine nucleosidase